MADITLCYGLNCKVKKRCYRHTFTGVRDFQSYMGCCKDKKLFMGKKKRKQEKWW